MATYISEITGCEYTGEFSFHYDHHDDVTQLYIGEAMVQEISGCLDADEAQECFEDYYKESQQSNSEHFDIKMNTK